MPRTWQRRKIGRKDLPAVRQSHNEVKRSNCSTLHFTIHHHSHSSSSSFIAVLIVFLIIFTNRIADEINKNLIINLANMDGVDSCSHWIRFIDFTKCESWLFSELFSILICSPDLKGDYNNSAKIETLMKIIFAPAAARGTLNALPFKKNFAMIQSSNMINSLLRSFQSYIFSFNLNVFFCQVLLNLYHWWQKWIDKVMWILKDWRQSRIRKELCKVMLNE